MLDDEQSIKDWIGHLKYVRDHPNKEEPAEFYQKLIDTWVEKLESLKKNDAN